MADMNPEKEDKISIALPDGTMVDAYEIDFDIESEPWTTVKLSDGTTLNKDWDQQNIQTGTL